LGRKESTMCTSLLYHVQGIAVFQHVKFEYREGSVLWTIRGPREHVRCPECGCRNVNVRNYRTRRILGLPTGGRKNILCVELCRIRCLDCGKEVQEPIPFADPMKGYTRRLARYAVELTKHTDIQTVAEHLGLNWHTIKEIEKTYLEEKYKRIPLKKVRMIGIDEIYVGKKKWLTVVLNLETGEVIFVAKGKDGDCLKPFLKKLRSARAQVEVVAMDMSRTYTAWVLSNFPQARIVYDKFHVIKTMNERLDSLRRELQRNLPEDQKRLLKGKRWLLLKARARLKAEHMKDLDEMLAINTPLAIAYQLKERLRCLWDEEDMKAAEAFLADWCGQAKASGIKQLIKMAETLESHWDGVLAYFTEGRVTSAKMEGFNNKIRWLIKLGYGYRDDEYFILKIYDLPSKRVQLAA
jgi:transposase